MTAGPPEWAKDEIARREAEDMAGRRKAYDDWARQYADSGVRVDTPARRESAKAPEARTAPTDAPRKHWGFRLGRGSR